MTERAEPAHTILIVDDEVRIRRTLSEYLTDEGYTVREAGNAVEAEAELAAAGGSIDLILLDVRMPGEDGVKFLERHRELTEEVPVVVMSGHGTIELAMDAVRLGAFDFLEKGFTPERLGLTVERGLRTRALERRHRELKEGLDALHRMVGDGTAMTELRTAVRRAAPTPAKVLILGENGVGKELVARAIHELSPRNEGAFIRLNCAAIPRDLVESELFGHEKGAFTGASALKRGKLELAHSGTLFLDEIGDMNLEAQSKLLRALESSEFERVGGTNTLSVDARVIAATNKDLDAEVEAGRFRRDLFYRLNVLPIRVPPLRERSEDIPGLIEHYLGFFRAEYGRPDIQLEPEAVSLLTGYRWPGNVRELRNLVERLVIMAPADDVDVDEVRAHLGPAGETLEAGSSPGADATDGGLKHAMESAERSILEKELEAAGWNVSQAARTLGIDRANLHRKMRRLGIERDGA